MEEKNSPIVFCEWLKLRRKALDLTQDELANRASCSVGALRKIESGTRRPSKQLAEALAKALDLPKDDFQTFIRVARGNLNLERLRYPGEETHRVLPDISQILHEDSNLTIPGSTPITHRIPLPTTPLIGRSTELKALVRIFNDPQCRLLTLTGIGGIGKTRLAIEFALEESAIFPGGVFYIPLTPVTSADKIVPAIADVLGFGFSGLSAPKEQLLSYLANSIHEEALFIFDNMEHLLGTHGPQGEINTVEFVSEILQRLPHIKLLATSRERLSLHGEWTYELHGLSVPPIDFAGQLEEYNAVDLFLKSAQRNKADFLLADGELEALVQICQMVEGVPLAIELAAAWVGMLTCHEIAHEIKVNMDFLATSMHDIPERHRSIRAAFNHSWKLLSEEERLALCQLSVFHGGFDRWAADRIAGASLQILASLNSKSLVRRTKDGRYDLHEVIRQNALSNLQAHPSSSETYKRHCEYYLCMLNDQENRLKGIHQQDAMRQLTYEIDNFRAAWVWAIDNQQYSLLEPAGRAFGWYFEIAGLYREGIEQLESLLQALKSDLHKDRWTRLFGLAVNHLALLYFRKGEFTRALDLYKESIDILRPIGDQTLLADSMIFHGTILHLIGDYNRARSSCTEGLAFARAARNQWFEAYAIYNLGYIDSLIGDFEQGYTQMIAALDLWRSLGDPQSIALGLNFIIPTLIKLERFEEAISFMNESISLCEQAKNRWGLGTAHRYMGLALTVKGDLSAGRIYIQKSLEIFGGFAEGWDIALSFVYLAEISRLGGNFSEAINIYRDALRVSFESQAIPITLESLLGYSKLQAQTGDKAYALMLCAFILNQDSSESETKYQASELRSELELNLSASQIEAAFLDARGKSIESLVAEILETT